MTTCDLAKIPAPRELEFWQMEGEWQGLMESSNWCEELDVPMPGGPQQVVLD